MVPLACLSACNLKDYQHLQDWHKLYVNQLMANNACLSGDMFLDFDLQMACCWLPLMVNLSKFYSFLEPSLLTLQPGVIPVAVIASAAPVSFVPTPSTSLYVTPSSNLTNKPQIGVRKLKNLPEKSEIKVEMPDVSFFYK